MTPMRIAWIGATPDPDRGGVPYLAGQILLGLAHCGAELELFLDSARTPFLDQLAAQPNVRITAVSSRWRYGRWYSRTAPRALISGTATRVYLGGRIAQRLVERHAVQPFDVVYRLSQIELLALRALRRRLPPIVVHPEVHAHGELRHHWRERELALRGESRAFFALNHLYLGYRALVQRRDVHEVAGMIAPSTRFADLIAADYGFPRRRIHVIPNAIDLERFHPAPQLPPARPVRLLFVSRLSVRKGVEQIVELSHRLRDLAGRVRIDCYGGGSLFSNYSALVDDLEPVIAVHHGHLPSDEFPALYRSAHGLLQPSMYEPYALTVGEALASGLPVIVSDEVGAREGVDPRVCRVHGAGDVGALEREVRRLVEEMERGWDRALVGVARAHAEQRLSRDRIAEALVASLGELRDRA